MSDLKDLDTGTDNVSVRVLTALIWLNDQFEGGETDFPKIKVRCAAASATCWCSRTCATMARSTSA